MLVSSLEELRLFSPSNSIDSFDTIIGFVSSSEHDFLKDKLGVPLYRALSDYYRDNILPDTASYAQNTVIDLDRKPFDRLLYLSQKAIVFDVFCRMVSLQTISISAVGVNVSDADNFKAADAQTIAEFKKACVKEAHSAINELLQTLEIWCADVGQFVSQPQDQDDIQKNEIVQLWKSSKYFYFVGGSLMPSASVLQEYYNIYDSREKFIQMLPDIRYIQEDVLAPIFGDELIDFVVDAAKKPLDASQDKHILRIVHSLRKILARYLEARLLSPTDNRVETARNEAIKLTSRLSDYISNSCSDFPLPLLSALSSSPSFSHCKKSVPNGEAKDKPRPRFANNTPDASIFVTPGLI